MASDVLAMTIGIRFETSGGEIVHPDKKMSESVPLLFAAPHERVGRLHTQEEVADILSRFRDTGELPDYVSARQQRRYKQQADKKLSAAKEEE